MNQINNNFIGVSIKLYGINDFTLTVYIVSCEVKNHLYKRPRKTDIENNKLNKMLVN